MHDGFYFDARLVEVDGVSTSHAPILSVSIHLKAGTGGSGERVNIRFSDTPHRVEMSHIDAYLFWNPQDRRPANWGDFVASGFPKSMRLSTLTLNQSNEVSLDLLFPLSPSLLSQMEETRPADKARYGVMLRITGILNESPAEVLPAGQFPKAYPFAAEGIIVWRIGSTDPMLEIERSKWTDTILPNLGVGRWMIYEVPVESFEGVTQADDYLNNALRQYSAHEWKLCMAACRDVVESLQRGLESTTNSAFGDRFASAPEKMRRFAEKYDHLVASALDFEAATKSLLAAGSHPERPEELVQRPDAELALWVALSLRRYVGMRLRETRPPGFDPPPPAPSG